MQVISLHSGRKMKKFEVADLSPGDLVKWDMLVDNSSHGTIFHKTGWLDACSHSLGKNVKIFGCFKEGLLIGGCSFFLAKKWGIFPYASSNCVMTPYGGFVLSSPPSVSVHKRESFSRQIIESLLEYIKKEQFFLISSLNSPEFLDVRPFVWKGWNSRVCYTYYVDLKYDYKSCVDPLVKSSIRKAEKNGISIEDFSDISRYYSLLCETFARKNLKPPAPKRLIMEIYSYIKNHNCGEMLVAKTRDGEIACAGIFLWDKRQAYNWSLASDARFLNSGASYLLLLEFFNRMNNRAIPRINLMMANIPELSNFTSHLNPILVPYYEISSWMIL
jgi:hypothetical protein